MQQPLVSIVVISYNQGKYIRENLDSIKAQTYQNIELIVGDDASQDDSVEVFEAWLEENGYPTVFKNYHKANTGLATMLNECIEKATGKYVKLIAADDFLHPESIEKCVAKLEEAGEECGMVFTDTYIINEESEQIKEEKTSKLDNYTEEELAQAVKNSNGVAAPSVLLSVAALRKTGPYSTKLLVEDYHRWLLILQKHSIRYIGEKLCYYRWHSDNITKHRRQRIAEETALLRLTYLPQREYSKAVNDSIKWLYQNFGTISNGLKAKYHVYPHRNKKIDFFLRSGLPYFSYELLEHLYNIFKT